MKPLADPLAYLREVGAKLERLPDDFSHKCMLGAEGIRIFLLQRTPDGRVAQASAMVTWECIEDAAVNPLTLSVDGMLRKIRELVDADR